jgi:hypothetical protein
VSGWGKTRLGPPGRENQEREVHQPWHIKRTGSTFLTAAKEIYIIYMTNYSLLPDKIHIVASFSTVEFSKVPHKASNVGASYHVSTD